LPPIAAIEAIFELFAAGRFSPAFARLPAAFRWLLRHALRFLMPLFIFAR
jgi:hypothetical protein